ncbi:MAG: penicillin-binding transpeptidase domain-containing protein [Akkermansiaceae bacterium]
MEPKYRFRLYLLTALVLTGCGTLLTRLYEFQINRRSQFVANIPTTHTVTIREPGVRGEVVDRNGVVLARNRRSYEVVFNLDDIYKSYRDLHQQTENLETDPTAIDQKGSEMDIVRIVNEEVIPGLEHFGLKGERFTKALRSHYLTHGGLVPFVYKTDLTKDQFAQIAVRNNELQGVEVRVAPRRVYPYGSLAGHVLGYVKQWEKGDLPEEYRNNQSRMHYQGDDLGISGIELTMDEYLKGEGGKRILVRNEKQKVIATDDYTPAREGARVQLTLDANLQYIVENVMRRVGRGAAVVMDPNTGEVLAMASVPNFDPNHFVPAITTDQFKVYNTNKATPFMNRAINAFIPGSTFKLPTAIAGLLRGNVGFFNTCIGYNSYGKTLKIGCWKTYGHGPLGLSEAIQRSCNPYFMSMAGLVGRTSMQNSFERLGLGVTSGIRLPDEAPGLYPGSREWRNDYPGATIYPADLGLMSIGQGKTGASPLQLCAITSTIANGGRHYQPRIVRRVVGTTPAGEREILLENIPIVKADLLKEGVSPEDIEVVRNGMWKAANELGGTAFRYITMKDVFVGAKTGTAQVSKTSTTHSHNAWTTSFAPYDSPRYAVTVMVVNGKSGGKVAGALSHLIYRGIFGLEAGLKPPLGRMGIYEGHFDPIEEIPLPEGDFMALPVANDGESADEVDLGVAQPGTPLKVKPKTIALPSIAPTPDDEDESPDDAESPAPEE